LVKLFLDLFNLLAMKLSGGVEGELHGFLTLTLDENEWSVSGPCHFMSGKRAMGTNRRGGCFGPQKQLGLCGEKKIYFSCRQSNPDSSVV
jgi:hypothetical protein